MARLLFAGYELLEGRLLSFHGAIFSGRVYTNPPRIEDNNFTAVVISNHQRTACGYPIRPNFDSEAQQTGYLGRPATSHRDVICEAGARWFWSVRMNFPLYCLNFGNRPFMLEQAKIRGKALGIFPVFTTRDAAEQFGNHLPPDVASKLPSERIKHLQSREELAAVLLVAKDAKCAFVAWDPDVPSAKSGRKQPLSELLAGLHY